MAWQVPIISLTAQAFLFTIALGPDSSPIARYFASGLSILVTILCMLLMARHRQADIADAEWLADLEASRKGEPELLAHGHPWRRRRDATDILAGTPLNLVKRWTVFVVWEVGLLIFGLAALAIIVLTIVAPDLLASAPEPQRDQQH